MSDVREQLESNLAKAAIDLFNHSDLMAESIFIPINDKDCVVVCTQEAWNTRIKKEEE